MGMIIRELVPADSVQVRDMLDACGAFNAEEVRVAMEMVADDEYTNWCAEIEGTVRGYACIGKTPLTRSSWYLYWTCIHPSMQKMGVGSALHARVEDFIRGHGGERLVVETSGRPDYAPTRRFYHGIGYREVGRIENFYKLDDDCVILCKVLE